MADNNELIISELKRVSAMLYKNQLLFDLAADDAETEALIYEKKALEIRYSALIGRAKQEGIKGDFWKWLK